MRYHSLGNTGLQVSVIGLGMEHLQPTSSENVKQVVRRAIEMGVNYIDLMIWTAQGFDSLAAALQDRRDGVYLAAHLGVGQTKGHYRRTRDVQESTELFHDILRRLHTDHVDVLHITYLDQPGDYRLATASGGVMELAQRLKREGKTRAVSLSGHNPLVAMQGVREGYLDVAMQPVHIALSNNPKTAQLCAFCAAQGVGLAAMKPFAGGELLQGDLPLSPAQCLHYTLSQPGVSVAVAGVKSVTELDVDLHYLEAGAAEKDFSAALQRFQQGLQGVCTYCNHCAPCPEEIDVSAMMQFLADTRRFGVDVERRYDYAHLAVPPSSCVECGVCVERCPFGVDIVAELRELVRLYEP